jgi:hypothetical protein
MTGIKAAEGFHFGGTFYGKGDPVPDEVAQSVGDHVLTEAPDRSEDGSQFDGEAFDKAVEAKVQDQLDETYEKGAADQRAREQASYDALSSQEDEFDPSADGVKASDVKAYLEGLDTDTVSGQAEYDRVVQAEQDGANRSTALPD